MKNTGRKKTAGMDFNRVPDKDWFTPSDLMYCLGYSPNNKSSFYKLKAKGQLPSYFRLGGTIYFPKDRVIQFYTNMRPAKNKTRFAIGKLN